MPELRWILLGLGVLFCLGLWWWETRRGRQAASSRASLNPTGGLTITPTIREAPRASAIEPPVAERELPPWDATIAGEDEEEAAEIDIELAPAREPVVDIAAERPPGAASAGLGRVEPVFGDPTSVVGPAPADSAVATPSPRAPSPEKIVTLRVSAPPLERFEGGMLVRALRAAGLEHGKFSIFHKIAVDGATLFSAASLVEPGTFDLDAIEGRRFPGVSMFAVLTDQGDGGAVLEEMLETARSLAAGLHGIVQDERGASLNPQRLAELRADVFAWARRHQGAGGPRAG